MNMTILALIVILTWLWMMATALHLDDVRTETLHPSSLPVGQREPQ
jgi:signal transduction histidine kinase